MQFRSLWLKGYSRRREQWQNEGQFHLISHPRGYILFPKIADFKRDQHATKITVAVQYQIETLGYFKGRVLHEYAALHLDGPRRANLSMQASSRQPTSRFVWADLLAPLRWRPIRHHRQAQAENHKHHDGMRDPHKLLLSPTRENVSECWDARLYRALVGFRPRHAIDASAITALVVSVDRPRRRLVHQVAPKLGQPACQHFALSLPVMHLMIFTLGRFQQRRQAEKK
jgi:hypothetical protein